MTRPRPLISEGLSSDTSGSNSYGIKPNGVSSAYIVSSGFDSPHNSHATPQAMTLRYYYQSRQKSFVVERGHTWPIQHGCPGFRV